jgi:hypothetical protein
VGRSAGGTTAISGCDDCRGGRDLVGRRCHDVSDDTCGWARHRHCGWLLRRRIVDITRWYPKERHGTALGILGAGRRLRVWRFGLDYFFTFGGYVALSVWLPRYLIAVYGLDIRTAAAIAIAFSMPCDLFRVSEFFPTAAAPTK